jgi:hypothetical protein
MAAVKQQRHGLFANGSEPPPEYWIWVGIKERCFNPKKRGFHVYGGRGITICDAWKHDFLAFFAYVGPRPSRSHSIDRKNVNGHYEPGNVRWATKKEQALNTRRNLLIDGMTIEQVMERTGLTYSGVYGRLERGCSVAEILSVPQPGRRKSNRFLTYDGRTMTMTEWVKEKGMRLHVLSQRLRHGWSIDRALNEPVGSSDSRGTHSARAKLTEEAVVAIRASTDSACALARQYGVSDTLIHAVRKRRIWTHV